MANSTAPIFNMLPTLPISMDSVGSDQVHSLTIGGWNTWTTWHLIPKERPFVKPPNVKMEFVDIPGSDITLDYTESIDENIHYKNREGSWTFIMVPDGESVLSRYSTIMNTIHGKHLTIVCSDDPDYRYSGRVWVGEPKSEDNYTTITISYNVDPYKYLISDPTQKRL